MFQRENISGHNQSLQCVFVCTILLSKGAEADYIISITQLFS